SGRTASAPLERGLVWRPAGSWRWPGPLRRCRRAGQKAVEDVPEDLGLADQRHDATLLKLVGGRVAADELQRHPRVLPRPRHSRAEVLEHVRPAPRVTPLPG